MSSYAEIASKPIVKIPEKTHEYTIINSMVYNEHTIYVESGSAYPSNITEILEDVFDQCDNHLGEPVCRKYKMNYVIDNTGKHIGVTYIDFDDFRVYNMIVGKNPDGSKRVRIIEDTNHKARLGDITPGTNWGDIADLSMPHVREETLEPLIRLKSYVMDNVQKEINGLDVEEEITASIRVSPCYISKYCDEDFHSDKLVVFFPDFNLSNREKERITKGLFSRYNRTKPYRDNFSVTSFKKNILVSFNHYADCEFAFKMLMKCKIEYKGSPLLLRCRRFKR